MTYDPVDNSSKCYALAIREIRLDRIRKGLSVPREHHPEEVEAWRQGVIARGAIKVAIAAAFSTVAVIALTVRESLPVGKSGVLAQVQTGDGP